jgi:hypothetical protein
MDMDLIVMSLENTMILLANEIVEIEDKIEELRLLLDTNISIDEVMDITDEEYYLVKKKRDYKNMIEQLYQLKCKFEEE